MVRHTFRWPYPADEVYVTGSFDDWAKTVKLARDSNNEFVKEVDLPDSQRIDYKFVVDGDWRTDSSAPEIDDGHNNINNCLLPHQLSSQTQPSQAATSAAESSENMSGVTPDSTTAGMAGNVPKSTPNGPGSYAISSAAPESTTAQLAKDVPLEDTKSKQAPPGTFPETPDQEPEQVSVNPIPASSGVGNPVHLQPGEKVPDPATINNNTVQSTATTDKAGYEKGASAAGIGSTSAPDQVNQGKAPGSTPDNPTIQSAAPGSTSAGLAGGVPVERNGSTEPKASAIEDVPPRVRDSIERSRSEPEAAASKEAVAEKKEMERELLKEISPEESSGAPGPVASAETSERAPAPTQPVSKARDTGGDISPKTKEPGEPAVTTGPETSKTSKTSTPGQETQGNQGKTDQAAPAAEGESAKGKKKNRVSGLFSKLKEKLK